MNELIIKLFEESPQEFISGEHLSNKLNCSRTAIWKHIQSLRLQGYEFDSMPRRGYRMTSKPTILNLQTIKSLLKTKVMGINVTHTLMVDSTQTLAHSMVAKGSIEGALVIAEQQTEGRGRLGKKWFSPAGKGIWFSLILKPDIPLQFMSQLTLLVSVALCRTIRKKYALNAGIKWPNDILINGRKISGILLESSAEEERLRYVIAGVGISANMITEDFPVDLIDKASSLRIELGRSINREELLCGFLEEFECLYDMYNEQGFAPIRMLWEALSVSLHCPIEVQTKSGRVEAIAHGLDEMGALMVTVKNGPDEKIYSGDVIHLNI